MALNMIRQLEYWQNTAERNMTTASYLLRGRRYDACLFFCHLAIEKLLKGLVVAHTKDFAPYLHNLPRLGELAGLVLRAKQAQQLKEITAFNIAGRYDNEKYAFYKKCTAAYTKRQYAICQQIYLWLKREYQKKS